MKKTTKIVCGVIITAVVAGGTFTGLYYGVPGIRTEIDSIGQNTSQEIVKPDAPAEVKTSAKATSLTVEPIENAEYSLDGVIWQDSNVFTGLEPNTEYSIKVRLKQNGATPASDSTTIVATTSKYVVLQTPNVEAKQVEPTSITIESTDDFVEYSIDGVNYQSSPVFAGLAPNTTYLVYARTLETTTSYASEPKTLIITTPKYTQAEIPSISITEITSSAVTFKEIEGVEYSLDGVNWQDSNVFNGLNPATTYTVLARFAETATHYVGDTNSITITTEKTEQTAPVIECVEVTTDSITVTALENAEYSLDGATWQDSNVFNGLNPATTYTIFAHYKETQTLIESNTVTIDITTLLASGLYNAENVMIYSWNDLLEQNYLSYSTSNGLVCESAGASALNGKLVIDDSVIKISDLATAYNLTSIVLPNNDSNLFYNNIFPKPLESYNYQPVKLASIEVAGSNSKYASVEGVLYNKSMTNLYCYPSAKEGTSFDIPDSVKTVKATAFAGLTKLTNIVMPNNINWEYGVFANSSSLQNVTIASDITELPQLMFQNCTSLNNVHLPSNIVNISNQAFQGCTGLNNISISDGLQTIGMKAFQGCNSLENIELPSSLISLYSNAFWNCDNLKSLIFNSNVPILTDSGTLSIGANTIIYVKDEYLSAYQIDTAFANYNSETLKPLSEYVA